MSAQGLLLDVGVVFFKSAWEIADDYERLRGLPAGTVVGRGPLDPEGDERWQRYLGGEATEAETQRGQRAGARGGGNGQLLPTLQLPPLLPALLFLLLLSK